VTKPTPYSVLHDRDSNFLPGAVRSTCHCNGAAPRLPSSGGCSAAVVRLDLRLCMYVPIPIHRTSHISAWAGDRISGPTTGLGCFVVPAAATGLCLPRPLLTPYGGPNPNKAFCSLALVCSAWRKPSVRSAGLPHLVTCPTQLNQPATGPSAS